MIPTFPLMAILCLTAPAPPSRGDPEARWLAQNKGMKKTAAVTLSVGATVDRASGGLQLPLTIENRSATAVTVRLAHEWHGGEWPPTALSASVTPARAATRSPFHPAYLFGESSSSARPVTIPPGKSVTVRVRVDWRGTGSVRASPLIDPAAPGSYKVRVLVVVEGAEKRYAVSGLANVELRRR